MVGVRGAVLGSSFLVVTLLLVLVLVLVILIETRMSEVREMIGSW